MSEKKYVVPEHDQKRFWRMVDKRESCWLWTGGTSLGYGSFKVGTQNYRAHRLSYTLLRGEIPEGLHLDHLCRVRNCVNPDHLEPVTQKENTARGYAYSAIVTRTNICKNGHSMDDAYIYRSGKRSCRKCIYERGHEYNKKRYFEEHPNAKYYRARKKPEQEPLKAGK